MSDQDERKELDPVPVEVDGGGWYWYYVCTECRCILTRQEEYCPGCKRRLDWNG